MEAPKKAKHNSDADLLKVKAQKVKNGRRVQGQVNGIRAQQAIKKSNRLLEEAAYEKAVAQAFEYEDSGGIIVEGDGEHTSQLRQSDIVKEIDAGTASKVLDLTLNLGPYMVDVTRSGQYALLAGRKGDISLINLRSQECVFQKNVLETIRCIKFCFNENFWACAQKKYISIYDKQGVELHCFKKETGVLVLDYLPLHFLLTSIGEFGMLKYRDIATGQFAAVHKTQRGACTVMRHNPYNAIVNLGHVGGTVTLWSPNVSKPLVEFFAHRGGVTSLCPFNDYNLATAGNDGFWRVWDVRQAQQCISSVKYIGTPPTSMDVSHTGLLAMAFGPHTQVWRNVNVKPDLFLRDHNRNGHVMQSVCYRPFEDILYVGHSHGLRTMLVPGAGLASPDSLLDNPYESAKVKSSKLVRRLIEKLPASSIVFDPEKLVTL